MPSSIKDLENRFEARNLLGIYASLTKSNLNDIVENFKGKNFSEFKQKLSEVLVEEIDPIAKEIKKLMNEKKFLDNILDEGYEKANNIASEKLKKCMKL